jgi:hypothetical protein
MSIVDDGSGLSAKTLANPGIGLQIMQYRARMVGAALSVARVSTEGGTLVTCSLPVVEPGGKRPPTPTPPPPPLPPPPQSPMSQQQQTGVPEHAQPIART